MPGDVRPSGKRVDPNLIEAEYDDVGSTGQDGRSNARVEAQSDGIEVCIGIHEGLEEIVDASDELISEPGGDDAIVDRIVVLHVRGHDLPVRTQMCVVRGRLCSLPEKYSKRDAVVFIEAVVEFEQAIVAVPIGRIRIEIISRRRGTSQRGRRPQPVDLRKPDSRGRCIAAIRLPLPLDMPARVPWNATGCRSSTSALPGLKKRRSCLSEWDHRGKSRSADSGAGLPTEKADEIFDAFFTTKPQGSGMGLTISRSIIQSHGGRLWAGTNARQGVTFYFTLPSERTHSRLSA